MRTTIVLITLSALLTAAACSRDVAVTATPVAAAGLPADVSDLVKKPDATILPAQQTLAIDGLSAESETIYATGELISPMRSEVAPKIGGRVAEVYVGEGEHVRAGQPLAVLETDYLLLDLKRAEAELSRLRAVEGDAALDLERKKELLKTESVSRARYDSARHAHQAAVAAREAAWANAALVRRRFFDSIVRAPFKGVVQAKQVEVGERIGEGTPSFIIAQTHPLKVRFQLPEQYVAKLHAGQKVETSIDAYPAEIFEGRIAMIGGVVDTSTRTIAVEADVKNADGRLRPGMFARVTLAE